MDLQTPRAIDVDVERLCAALPDAGEPMFLKLRREKDAVLLDCYGNVERKIDRDGGSVQYGWCVWKAEGRLIEGEFHAVWKSSSGELIDITPKRDGERQILFIPDNKTVYRMVPIGNVRVALSDDPEVAATIKLNEAIERLRVKYNDGTGHADIPQHEIDRLTMKAISRPVSVEKRQGRNERCSCGSGQKHKNCCGKI